MLDTDTSIVLDDDTVALVDELRSIRDTTKVLKAREDEIRATLLEQLEGAEQGINASGVPVVEVQYQSRTRVDTKRLQALYQEVWKDCQADMTVTTVRLPETGI
jgi:predicted phage-related endonuclease